jgi:hypothetical protein
MLSLSDVSYLYYEGVDLKLRRKLSLENPLRKGLWDPGFNEVNIYLPQIESKEDFYLTLLHEFIHAIKDYNKGNSGEDNEVDDLALKIMQENPNLPKEILDFYQIIVPIKLR